MLPNDENNDDLELDFEDTEIVHTKTFEIDSNGNHINGYIKELESLKQSIYLMLSTEADQYIIYPYDYGLTTLDLIGKPSYYVAAVLPDRIKETLLSDNRITDVSDFEFETHKNQLSVQFVVSTIYGDVEAETVVNY